MMLVKADFVKKALQYLACKPYQEVHQLIALLSSAQPFNENKYREDLKKEMIKERLDQELVANENKIEVANDDNKEGQ